MSCSGVKPERAIPKREGTMTYEEIVGYVQKKAAKADVKKLDSVAIQVDIIGEGEGAFYVAINDGKIQVEPYEYFDHDAKLVTSAEDLKAILEGKEDACEALNSGKIRIEGDQSKIAVFAKLAVKKEAAKPAEKKAEPKKAAKPAEKKAEPAKAAKPAEKKAEPAKAAKPAEKKAEPAKAAKPAAKKAEPKKAAAKPAAKKPAKKK